MLFELIPFTARSPLFHDAVRVYCTVWQRATDDSTVFFRKYTQMPDFVGYVARVETDVVGVVFGVASQTGQWWPDQVARQVGRRHHALQRAWILTELAVLAPYRKHRIGSHLLERV
ncbi:MAG: hypothetical protein ACFE0Q_18190, partial [Anaerolineae bacterium]